MCEVQDILAVYGKRYADLHPLSLQQQKAFCAITACRTDALGGHSSVCPECGTVEVSYNSCKNRHCPKCQAYRREAWLERQSQDLLDVPYFHVVFTVPECLNVVFMHNQEQTYALLLRASAAALGEMCADRRHLGARCGHTAVLHTWGQNLSYHPHVHCVVPAGGLNTSGRWKASSKKFFLPVKALSKLFRGKFMAALKSMRLEFYNESVYLNDPAAFQPVVDQAYSKEWVVYCKPPFTGAGSVLSYLGRYTHRVAIANSRVISLTDGKVSFRWRDYADDNKVKVMALDAMEFIRRLMMHVLPHGFTKIRHYGLLANRGRHARMDLCKRLTNTPLCERVKADPAVIVARMLGRPPGSCKACGAGMVMMPLIA